MNFEEYLKESYYNKELMEFFSKLMKVNMVNEINMSNKDEFLFDGDKDISHYKDILKNSIVKIHKRLVRQKYPPYSLELSKIDDGKFKLTINFMTDIFRKKLIYHATSRNKLDSILKNGISPMSVLESDVIIDYEDSDDLVMRLYRGSFFFGAKSLARSFGKAKYGNNNYVLIGIHNGTGKYDKYSYYEPKSKEKYGYSHSFFITKEVDAADIFSIDTK